MASIPGGKKTWANTIRGRHCIRTSKESNCGGGSKSYFARAEKKDEGLNETLGRRLAKKNVEIFGYVGLWIQAGVLLDALMSDKYKRSRKQLSRHYLRCRDTVAETISKV